jgi:hypothetical protein
MISSTGSNGARGEAERNELTLDPRQPDHLVVWLRGHINTGDDQVIDDGRLVPDFSLSTWTDEVRRAYPDSIVGASFPPHLMGRHPSVWHGVEDHWLDLTRVAAGIDVNGDDRAFTGDTTPTSLRTLRRWVTMRLEGHAVELDDIVLSLSELSTNVERHGGDWLTVDVVDRGHVVVLAVTDPAQDRLPQPRSAGPDDTSGRGLLVVASLAARWGVVIRPMHKTVWAAFPTTG